MRYLLFICPFFLLLACSGEEFQEVEQRDEQGTLLARYTIRTSDGAKHGTYTAFYPEGSISERAEYRNDTLHGERRLFYPDGTVQIIEHYEHGRFEGLYQAFYPNGQLELEGRYLNNEMTGEWKRYYDSGELMEIVTFAHNAENGPFREFHKNGALKTEGTYRNGDFEHGELKSYDENGTLVRRMQCLEGICQTVWTLEEGDLPFDEEAFRAKVKRLKTIERLEAAVRR